MLVKIQMFSQPSILNEPTTIWETKGTITAIKRIGTTPTTYNLGQQHNSFRSQNNYGGNLNDGFNQGNKHNQPWHNQYGHLNNTSTKPVCQLCEKPGHIAKFFRSQPQAHFTTNAPPSNTNWIMDSGSSYHITSDLQNLAIDSNYGGNDGITIRDD